MKKHVNRKEIKIRMNMSDIIVGGQVLGAIIAGAIGIITVIFAEYYREHRAKEKISRALYGEVKGNQRMLVYISTSISQYRLIPEGKIIPGGGDDTEGIFSEFSRGVRFERSVYTALSDKIGILDIKNLEGLVEYYVILNIIEVYFLIVCKALVSIKDEQKRKDYREGFLKRAEEAHRMGESVLKEIERCVKF